MLNKTQIRYLKAQAHMLHPVVMIGSGGLSDNVHQEIERALTSHELIKVKLGALPDDEQETLIRAICQQNQADFVQKIGHIAVIFRANPDKARYALPR